ncbi:MAG: hypothetical protein QM645_04785 [Asticcacaulis sp.]
MKRSAYTNTTLPVPVGPVKDHTRPKPDGEDAGYTVQRLGEGEKRGLRGGRNTLDAAKSTYLQAEFSGSFDRRPRPGRVTRQKI